MFWVDMVVSCLSHVKTQTLVLSDFVAHTLVPYCLLDDIASSTDYTLLQIIFIWDLFE